MIQQVLTQKLNAGTQIYFYTNYQCYSQWPKGGSNSSDHQQINGYTKCGKFIQWNIIQS